MSAVYIHKAASHRPLDRRGLRTRPEPSIVDLPFRSPDSPPSTAPPDWLRRQPRLKAMQDAGAESLTVCQHHHRPLSQQPRRSVMRQSIRIAHQHHCSRRGSIRFLVLRRLSTPSSPFGVITSVHHMVVGIGNTVNTEIKDPVRRRRLSHFFQFVCLLLTKEESSFNKRNQIVFMTKKEKKREKKKGKKKGKEIREEK